jgi:hypothetical protein
MPNRKTKGRRKGPRSARGDLMGQSNTRVGYENTVRVSGAEVLTASTTGGTYWGITPFGAGAANWFTPSSQGTNYASLSQYGDFRCKAIRLTLSSQTPSSATTSVTQAVAALDGTGTDAIVGGAASNVLLVIGTRQSAVRRFVSNAQFKPVVMNFRPKELQNRLWAPQSALGASSGTLSNAAYNWGVLLALAAPGGNTVYVNIDWFFEVREPTLSGVLLGKETPEEKKRLDRLNPLLGSDRASELPASSLPPSSVQDQLAELRSAVAGIVRALSAKASD